MKRGDLVLQPALKKTVRMQLATKLVFVPGRQKIRKIENDTFKKKIHFELLCLHYSMVEQ